ncbi:MAG: lysyl oxidase family protein [Myxococcota bacterium]|nr:lysyl oxidase family protein [Myxococcota bacterium]
MNQFSGPLYFVGNWGWFVLVFGCSTGGMTDDPLPTKVANSEAFGSASQPSDAENATGAIGGDSVQTSTGLPAGGAISMGPAGHATRPGAMLAGGQMTPSDARPDLVVDIERLTDDIWIDQLDVTEEHCGFREGCLEETGRRTLLRFALAAANVGDADLVVGRPQNQEDVFHYSECHEHFHREGFATYRLEAPDGTVRRGGKHAFCLMDSVRTLDESGVREVDRYHCGYQGISRGWADDYGSELDCQWVDITGLEPGAYRLIVEINADRSLPESETNNNRGQVAVFVPMGGLETPCGEGPGHGARKACGWRKVHQGECVANRWVTATCQANASGLPCDDGVHLRACPGGEACYPSVALAPPVDERTRPACTPVEFLCEADGTYGIWMKKDERSTSTNHCEIRVVEDEIPLTRPCPDDALLGPDRVCGWSVQHHATPCDVGALYRIGCLGDGLGEACALGEMCRGDPMIRVCPGRTMCGRAFELGSGDDACGTKCPMTVVRCPAEGEFSVFVTAHDHRRNAHCLIEIEPL